MIDKNENGLHDKTDAIIRIIAAFCFLGLTGLCIWKNFDAAAILGLGTISGLLFGEEGLLNYFGRK